LRFGCRLSCSIHVLTSKYRSFCIVMVFYHGIEFLSRVLMSFHLIFYFYQPIATSIHHFIYSSILFNRRQDGSVDEEERERGSGLIEEEETPPVSPTLCSLTAALWAVFRWEEQFSLPDHTRPPSRPDGADRAVFPSVRLRRFSSVCFLCLKYDLANDEGVLGVVFINFEATERIVPPSPFI